MRTSALGISRKFLIAVCAWASAVRSPHRRIESAMAPTSERAIKVATIAMRSAQFTGMCALIQRRSKTWR